MASRLHPMSAGTDPAWWCRAARFANAAAHGGQIMMPQALACKLVHQLTGQQLSLNTSEPLALATPDFLPHRMHQSQALTASTSALGPVRARRFEEQRRTADVSPTLSR